MPSNFPQIWGNYPDFRKILNTFDFSPDLGKYPSFGAKSIIQWFYSGHWWIRDTHARVLNTFPCTWKKFVQFMMSRKECDKIHFILFSCMDPGEVMDKIKIRSWSIFMKKRMFLGSEQSKDEEDAWTWQKCFWILRSNIIILHWKCDKF